MQQPALLSTARPQTWTEEPFIYAPSTSPSSSDYSTALSLLLCLATPPQVCSHMRSIKTTNDQHRRPCYATGRGHTPPALPLPLPLPIAALGICIDITCTGNRLKISTTTTGRFRRQLRQVSGGELQFKTFTIVTTTYSYIV